MNMKGQTQIMSAVLLTGIMVGLISVAYIWGGPMIQKQKDIVKLNNMENFMENLNKEIRDVAKNGGTSKLNVDLPGLLRIVNNGSGCNNNVDKIILEFETQGTAIEPGTEIVLEGEDKSVTKPMGNEAGVILEKAEKMGDKYRMSIKLFFRELVGQEDSYIINLVPSRRTQIGSIRSGSLERTIVITNIGSGDGTGSNGKDLSCNNIQIKI
ncbi:MAG: hypothetical protein ABEK17_00835 [Candidatus Aenigmatarchaeota archaeon]